MPRLALALLLLEGLHVVASVPLSPYHPLYTDCSLIKDRFLLGGANPYDNRITNDRPFNLFCYMLNEDSPEKRLAFAKAEARLNRPATCDDFVQYCSDCTWLLCYTDAQSGRCRGSEIAVSADVDPVSGLRQSQQCLINNDFTANNASGLSFIDIANLGAQQSVLEEGDYPPGYASPSEKLRVNAQINAHYQREINGTLDGQCTVPPEEDLSPPSPPPPSPPPPTPPTCVDDPSFIDQCGHDCRFWAHAFENHNIAAARRDTITDEARGLRCLVEHATCDDVTPISKTFPYAEPNYGPAESAAIREACCLTCDAVPPSPPSPAPCCDDIRYRTSRQETCQGWEGYDCFEATSRWGYSPAEQRTILDKCQLTCGVCGREDPVTSPRARSWTAASPITAETAAETAATAVAVEATASVANVTNVTAGLQEPALTAMTVELTASGAGVVLLGVGAVTLLRRRRHLGGGAVSPTKRAIDEACRDRATSFEENHQASAGIV